MNILITGATGFIGAYVTRCLAEASKHNLVIAYDIKPETTRLGPAPKNVSIIQGDLLDPTGLLRTIQQHNVEYVVHLAAYVSHADPVQLTRVNCSGTTHIFEAARLQKVKRVVYATSGAVFPSHVSLSNDSVDEDVYPRPSTLYGASKVFNELEAQVYWQTFGLDMVGLRIPPVFGLAKETRPGRIRGVWVDAPYLAAAGRPINLPAEKQFVDWIHGLDLARVVLLALTIENPLRRIYNVNSHVFPIGEWAAAVRRSFPQADISFAPEPIPTGRIMNSARLKRELGYEPHYTIDRAIEEFARTR